MEQARVFIAIVLSFLVFFAWEMFFVEKQAPEKAPAVQSSEEPRPLRDQAIDPSPSQEVMKSDTQSVPVVEKTAGTDRMPQSVVVQTPLLTAEISEKGAVFRSVRLLQYRESAKDDAPDKELIEATLQSVTGSTGMFNQSVAGFEEAIYSSNTTEDVLRVTDTSKNLQFHWDSPSGVVVTKTYTFHPDQYLIDVRITVMNGTMQTITDRLLCRLGGVVPEKDGGYGFQGASALIDGTLEQIKSKEIKKKDTFEGNFHWAAIQDRYFMKTIMPKNQEAGSLRLSLTDDTLLRADYVMPEMSIPSGGENTVEYQLFFGPRSVHVLEGIGHRLDEAIDFGWFDFIAKPCVWFMNFIYRYLPNYGVAIIILTLIVKLLLWPLGNKSYKSMSDMKKLQPLMAEIREKHQNDKQKMNQELMGLYKTYKINPMGGCLPMFLQIPVFIALYRMLYEAIELRHAPFIGWINDLSAPDRLFHFNFTIPLMEPPYGIPVLTIVMGATMLLQQKMSPPMGDPMQAKMMMLMPLVFTFIFINFPSGLVLYWLVNNVLSIAQQYYVTRKYA